MASSKNLMAELKKAASQNQINQVMAEAGHQTAAPNTLKDIMPPPPPAKRSRGRPRVKQSPRSYHTIVRKIIDTWLDERTSPRAGNCTYLGTDRATRIKLPTRVVMAMPTYETLTIREDLKAFCAAKGWPMPRCPLPGHILAACTDRGWPVVYRKTNRKRRTAIVGLILNGATPWDGNERDVQRWDQWDKTGTWQGKKAG